MTLNHSVVRFVINSHALHSGSHVARERRRVFCQDIGSSLIQRIVRVGLQKQKIQSQHHRIEGQNWRPIFTQDIKAHIAVEINVRMVYLGDTLDLGRINGEIITDIHRKCENSPFIVSFGRTDMDFEME